MCYPSVVLLDRKGGSLEEGGDDWLVVIYKHCALWLPFPRLKHKKTLVTRCVFSRPHLVWGFSYMCTQRRTHTQSQPGRQAGSAPPFFSLTHWSAHTQTHPMHAYTHPGSPWLLNCHCSEITASRTRQLGLRAGISYKPSSSAVRYFKCRQMGRELRELDYVWMYFCYFD